jgi:proline iminopeptidase
VRLLALVLALMSGASLLPAQTTPTLREGEGFVAVPGGRIWYRVVGHGPKTPLLVIHGCCGVGSYYLTPLAALGDDRPVVFYDQIDNGRSDHPGDTTLWRMPHFIDEIKVLREALGLKDIDVLGHSWGANVAVDYMLTKPPGVHALILAGPELDMSRYFADIARLVDALPAGAQRALIVHERNGTLSSPEYREALGQFYHAYLARQTPWSASLDSSVAHVNPAMNAYIYGPGVLDVTGWMKDYDRSRELPSITLPTLITVGRYDFTSVPSTYYYHNLLPNSRMTMFERSGHLMMQDEPEWYVSVVRSFLNQSEP